MKKFNTFNRVFRSSNVPTDIDKYQVTVGTFIRTISTQTSSSNFESELERCVLEVLDEDEYIVNLRFERIPDKDLGDDSILAIGDIVKLKDSDLSAQLSKLYQPATSGPFISPYKGTSPLSPTISTNQIMYSTGTSARDACQIKVEDSSSHINP